MTYDKILDDIVQKKKLKEQGFHNHIPFRFSKYHNYFYGFNPGEYIGLLGMTGSAKSRMTRQWIYDMVDFSMENSYPLKILYFALEDPEIPVGKKILTHYMYTRHGISLSSKALNSRDAPLPDKYIEAIKADKYFWEHFYHIVEIINELASPNQIQKKVAEVYKEIGQTHHIVVVIDNQSNLVKDNEDFDEWSAIKRLSRDIIRLKFCPKGITTIQVLQVDADTEKNAARNANRVGLANIEPNLASIADAKVVAKNMHYVFGLFDPIRFDLKEYPRAGDYNVSVLRGRLKSLLHLKSNEEEMGPRLPLLFDGRHEIFTELPSLEEKDKLEALYNKVIAEEREKRDKLLGGQRKMW